MSAPVAAPEFDPLPTPVVDGAAILLDDGRARLPPIDWRSSLLSLLAHLLFAALLVSLAYWMGKPPPEEPPAIEVTLAQDPEPPPPPAPPPPRRSGRSPA